MLLYYNLHQFKDETISFSSQYNRAHQLKTEQVCFDIENCNTKFGTIVSNQTMNHDWVADYPIIAYLKSSQEISIINLLDKKRSETHLNMHPFTIKCFVSTQAKCNQTLFFRETELESHILVLATLGTLKDKKNWQQGTTTQTYLLAIRIDAFNSNQQRNFIDSEQEIKCHNGHAIFKDTWEQDHYTQCSLCSKVI